MKMKMGEIQAFHKKDSMMALLGHAIALLLEALCYKQEGHRYGPH
jgi:hypothetical protein